MSSGSRLACSSARHLSDQMVCAASRSLGSTVIMRSFRCTEDEGESQALLKATPAVLNEPRASPRGRNSERNLGEKFHTGCAGQATLTRGSTTGNVRYPGFLAEDLVLALPNAKTIELSTRFHYPVNPICRALGFRPIRNERPY